MKDLDKIVDKYFEKILQKREDLCREFIKELLMSGDLTMHSTQCQTRAGMSYIPYQGMERLQRENDALSQLVDAIREKHGQEFLDDVMGV